MKNFADLGGCYLLRPSILVQQAALLTSLVQYDKVVSKFVEQQLVMVNYARGLF